MNLITVAMAVLNHFFRINFTFGIRERLTFALFLFFVSVMVILFGFFICAFLCLMSNTTLEVSLLMRWH